MGASLRAGALAYLREGKVVVHAAANRQFGERRAESIRADVFGQTRYVVGYEAGHGWWCSCKRPERPCRHVAAVQMVTGYPSAAAKGAPEVPAGDGDMDLDALLDMRAQARPGGEG